MLDFLLGFLMLEKTDSRRITGVDLSIVLRGFRLNFGLVSKGN